ncbi:ABC-type lipoprotein export system, ATPase component [Lishizhenia tianjinensis]|uniref:ABC-type lipoprotein export system, ATPase component n=1 Tax=Lishizhenia tianjinensis TaxID=477690 RepID=A0A1I6YNZ8_9FLAO|nr:ATP-binding cassette domain-containing protein [Lishizhenia tianjinensis]SFT52229.1 ABC-type lipoprotein export system, ATPase component [Lishizhenia tianjinensis]
MKISFKNVMPQHLADVQHDADSIWGNSFQIEAQSKVVLNASSGKGKTTFTTTLLGIRNNYSGDIHFGDVALKSLSKEDWATYRSSKIAVVYQDLQLFPELTVLENLEIKNQLHKTFSESELQNMLDELGVGNKTHERCANLSLGQQQRVAIIRALCQPFQWIILDEPFSHLDAENARKSLALIDRICDQEKAGFILTTLGDFYGYNYQVELKL